MHKKLNNSTVVLKSFVYMNLVCFRFYVAQHTSYQKHLVDP